MTDYVFIGRRRHWARTLIYGVLTLGIYGRVLLYKQVKEIDGHRALFIDLRVVVFLLVLPILGPFAVKMKVRRLVTETVGSDVTQPPVRRGALLALAFVPVVPVFHIVAQEHLNKYWRRQSKYEELRHKRAELEKLERGRMTDEKKAQVAQLQEQIERRQQALQHEEEAAKAIREAQREKERAEREFRASRRGPLGRASDAARARIPKRRPKESPEGAGSQEPEPEKPGLRQRFRALRGGASEENEEGAPEESPAEESASWRERLAGRRQAKAAAKAAEAEPVEETVDEPVDEPAKKRSGKKKAA